jgi:hypothetical protein
MEDQYAGDARNNFSLSVVPRFSISNRSTSNEVPRLPPIFMQNGLTMENETTRQDTPNDQLAVRIVFFVKNLFLMTIFLMAGWYSTVPFRHADHATLRHAMGRLSMAPYRGYLDAKGNSHTVSVDFFTLSGSQETYRLNGVTSEAMEASGATFRDSLEVMLDDDNVVALELNGKSMLTYDQYKMQMNSRSIEFACFLLFIAFMLWKYFPGRSDSARNSPDVSA